RSQPPHHRIGADTDRERKKRQYEEQPVRRMPVTARRPRLKPPAVGQAYRPSGAAPTVNPAAALAACLGRRQGRTHCGKRRAVRGEERDVGAQVGGEFLKRRLLLGLRRPSGRQRILRNGRGQFVTLVPWAVLAELVPEQACGKRKHGETREHGEIDANVELAHPALDQSCALAKTYPAPRPVMMRCGLLRSSSTTARTRH